MTALHSDPTIAARQRWMGVLARARREELDAHADALRDADYHLLRAAETGMTWCADAWAAPAARSTSAR